MKSIQIVLIILCFGNLLALMNTPQHIAGIPSGARFAGHEAVAYHNGNLYFVYLKNQADPKLRDLIFVRSSDGGQTYSFQTIATAHDYGICAYDSLGHFTTKDKSAPTLFVNDEHIIITYHDFGKFYTAISSDNGTSFTINQFDSGYDPLPLVQEANGQLRSYIANHDPATNMLYEALYNKFESENADLGVESGVVYFWGPDVIYGPVRSNTDIWVGQIGGGTNNGWPTFWGPVYTSGEIRSVSGVVPYETIFKGGVFEHVAPTPFSQIVNMSTLHGGPFFPLGQDSNKIVLVRVNGSGYNSWIGTKIPHINPYELNVYSSYPPPQGPVVATNTISYMDTIWVQGPSGSVVNNSIFCLNELWIEGTFSGKQIWACADTIKIIGNIKLTETALGTSPDGDTNPASANLHDYVALVSEKRIVIGYGYKDPADSLRKHPTCGSDGYGENSGIWIYASLFALGDGNGNPHQDGVFTFEYQHPHPSTPDQVIDGQIYDLNDLHSHIFPQTTDSPWPGALDYPWYNPLWPEANPYMERGYIHLYGSVYQQRAGFLHRSVSDPPNHDGTWNFANYKYGGHSQGINYPGATGTGVGYKRDRHYDTRLMDDTFNFSVNGNSIIFKVSSDMLNWELDDFLPSEQVISKTMQIGDQQLLTLNNHVYITRQGNQVLLPVQPQIPGHINRSFRDNSNAYMMTSIDSNTSDADTLQIVHLDIAGSTATSEVSFTVPVIGKMFDFLVNEEQQGLVALTHADGSVSIYKQDDASQYILAETWYTGLDLIPAIVDRKFSRMVLLPAANDSLYVLFYIRSADIDSLGTFYLAKGQMTFTGNHDNLAEPVSISLSAFPNPFTSEMKVNINTSKAQKTKIEIFNLRGQLVKTLCASENLAEGEYTLSWDGTDNKGNTVSTGVYFLKAKIGSQSLTRKIVRIK